jgi:Mg-chelatase subunit ChlD
MSTDFPTDPREALEASLTALLLDELPADQSAFLRDAIARDPDLARRYERLKQTINLVRITAKTPTDELPNLSPTFKLSQHLREELLQHLKTVTPRDFTQRPRPVNSWLVPLSVAALLLAVCGTVLMPALSKSKSRSMASARSGGERDKLESFKTSMVLEHLGNESALRLAPGQAQNTVPHKQLGAETGQQAGTAGRETQVVLPTTDVAEETLKPQLFEHPPSPSSYSFAPLSQHHDAASKTEPARVWTTLSGGGGIGGSGGLPESKPATAPNEGRAGGRTEGETQTRNKVAMLVDPATGLPIQVEARDDQSLAMIPQLQVPGITKDDSQSNQASISANADTEKLLREGKMEAQIKTWPTSVKLAGLDKKTEDMLHQKNENVLASGGVQSAEQRAFSVDERKLTETSVTQSGVKRFWDSDNDAPRAKRPTAAPMPQPEILTRENAFSTFSLNVSDVSFKLAAASLEKSVMPDPAGIRVEEFINAFDYRDPEPGPGVPIVFMSERAQYPFAQNRDLLRFSLKTAAQGRQAGRPLNLVLLLDNSGSMERADRVRIIQEALRVLAAQLQAPDTFSVVTFARTARLWVDGIPGNQAGKVAEEIGGLTPQGGTNLEEAMNLAYQTALRHYSPNGVNRVVLLTDGAANLGNVDPETLKQKVETNRKQGIALDCFGIGWEGYNDDLLELLTRNADGRYGFINTPEEAAGNFANQLAGAFHVAAADVKVQVEFNPSRVTVYRQIGYARHQLTKEQFRDNTLDAAEIGAAESGNALYVVEVNPNGAGPIAAVRVRYKVPGTSEFHEHEWPVPYMGKANSLQQASPALRLAATGSAFGEWLSTSPYTVEVTPDALLGYLNGIPEIYGADARPKTLEWMIRQAKSLTGQ